MLKLSSEAQLNHASYTVVTKGSSVLKLVSDEQLFHALVTLVAVGNGVLNEVSPLCCHAALKFTLVASVPSFAFSGNDVRAEQDFHADVKLFPVLKSKAGNEVSPLDCHALLKLTFSASVPSFASAGNDVRDEQPSHADVK